MDSASNVRGTYFGELEDDTIRTPFLIATKKSYPETYADLIIDINDHPHIVECQPNDSGYSLMHKYISNDDWNYSKIEENVNWYHGVNIKTLGSKIYLMYNKVDTTYFSPGRFNSDILFRKLEVLPGILSITSESQIKAYPNPFSEDITIEIPGLESKIVTFKVFDIAGYIVYEDIQDVTTTLSGAIYWQGRNKSGKKVTNGYYLLQILDREKSFLIKV